MSAASVPPEAIEAAARAQWNNWRGCRWEHGYSDDQQRIRDYARVDLEAAAPLIQAEVLHQADVRMFGTGEGGFLADDDQLPVGEIRRLLWLAVEDER